MRSSASFAAKDLVDATSSPTDAPRPNGLKHSLRIAASLALSALFLWIAVRGVSWQETSSALAAARLGHVVPIFVMSIVSLYFRALRWGVLVNPLARVRRESLFSATAMGFAANMLLPLRAGEVLRPWLLARKEGLHLAPVVATVAVERLFDMATLLFFFGVATLTLPLPPEWKRYGWVFLGTFFVFLGVLVLLLRFPGATVGALDKALTPLPETMSRPFLRAVQQFADGLGSLRSGAAIAQAVAYSLAVWLTLAVTFGFGLSALDLPVPKIRAALSLTTIVAIAVAVPGGPGFIGMFQVGCEVGLALYGVGKSLAFSYSVLVHVVQFASIVSLGLYFFLRENFTLRELRAEASIATGGESEEH
jgi:glycosyltransferase 2 family protein